MVFVEQGERQSIIMFRNPALAYLLRVLTMDNYNHKPAKYK
jgi:hypothetical protein